jgi:APA family basic amino acid/polyamine antiporter
VHNTIIVGVFIATLAAFVPLDILADLTSMGTLVAFAVVSVGVMILRRTQPDLPRGFKVPLYPIAPILSVAFCLYLIFGLPAHTFLLFAVWLAVALVVYFTYSVRNSQLSPARAKSGQAAGQ